MENAIKSLYRDLEIYDYKLSGLKIKLEKAKLNNSELENNVQKLAKAESTLNELQVFRNVLKCFDEVTSKEDIAYTNRRLDFLSSYIDVNLDLIFPNDGFKSKVHNVKTYGRNKAYLKITDKKGHERIPYITEGKLGQEIISFSSAKSVAESLDKNKIFMDEAFAASSPDNLEKVALILKDAVTKGFQIILIEQTSDGYKDIPRREIKLRKNPVTEAVEVVSCIDY